MELTLRAAVLYLLAVSANCEDLVVSIEDGPIRGTYQQSFEGRTYIAFEGIPYAQPPVGNLRFEDPQPANPWTDVLNATTSYYCTQIFGGIHIIGQEDCLYLNVFVPRDRINPEENLDVVVHIHGGAFVVGSPGFMAGPGLIMDRDVVYVTMSYRLGVFGFYSTRHGVNGNFGLKDQALSLRWIQNNIHHFGGNKDSVTITGLSAGGASVHLHYFSQLSRGLFHRGFALSGNALDSWAIQTDPQANARIIADGVGCPWEDIECLKTIPAARFLTVIIQTGGMSHDFRPTIEPESPTSFISEMPYSILTTNRVLDVPLLLSVVTEDGTVLCDWLYGFFDYLDQNWNEVFSVLFEYNNQETQYEISQKLRDFYLQDQPVTAETFPQVLQLCTDGGFHNGAAKSAKLQGSLTTSDVYVLVVGYAGQALTHFGVEHGVDGRFYFSDFPIGPPNLDEEEIKMKNIFLDMLVSFARTGVPNIEGVDFQPVASSGDFDYLFVAAPADIAPRNGKALGEHEFWDSLGIE